MVTRYRHEPAIDLNAPIVDTPDPPLPAFEPVQVPLLRGFLESRIALCENAQALWKQEVINRTARQDRSALEALLWEKRCYQNLLARLSP